MAEICEFFSMFRNNEKYEEKCQHNCYCSSGGNECSNMCYSCDRGCTQKTLVSI